MDRGNAAVGVVAWGNPKDKSTTIQRTMKRKTARKRVMESKIGTEDIRWAWMEKNKPHVELHCCLMTKKKKKKEKVLLALEQKGFEELQQR